MALGARNCNTISLRDRRVALACHSRESRLRGGGGGWVDRLADWSWLLSRAPSLSFLHKWAGNWGKRWEIYADPIHAFYPSVFYIALNLTSSYLAYLHLFPPFFSLMEEKTLSIAFWCHLKRRRTRRNKVAVSLSSQYYYSYPTNLVNETSSLQTHFRRPFFSLQNVAYPDRQMCDLVLIYRIPLIWSRVFLQVEQLIVDNSNGCERRKKLAFVGWRFLLNIFLWSFVAVKPEQATATTPLFRPILGSIAYLFSLDSFYVDWKLFGGFVHK